MAKKPTIMAAPDPDDKKPLNPRTADIQRRAQALASRKPVGARTFFQEAWVELKKTTWPTRPVLVKSTTVVLGLVIAVALWVGILDQVFSRLLDPVFGVRGH